MSPLPTLGGNNGEAGEINGRGEVAGNAENSTWDSIDQPASPKCSRRSLSFGKPAMSSNSTQLAAIPMVGLSG